MIDATLLSKEMYLFNANTRFDLNRDGKVNEIDLKEVWISRFGVKYFDIKTSKPLVPISVMEAEKAKKFVMAIFPQVVIPSQKQAITWGSRKFEVGK